MSMKKYYRFMLMAALVCGISFAVTSCKDDDNSGNGGASAEEQAADNANTFWSVAGNLVNPLDVTADYKNKTFEPTIGEPQEGSSTVRVVVMPDVEAAAKHFAAIVDADVKEATTTYTYQNDAVGTLIYTKSTDGKSLATVSVNIKQIPHLEQIVYKTPEQLGTNAVTDGVPYYWLGDVISRTRADGVKEYWICVQAPFTKQGKTDAIWATVSKLPEKNVYTYTASNDFKYQVPTRIGNNKEYMKDLTEMIYATCNPVEWEQNLTDGPDGMKAFNLVKKENVKYINQWFWQRVATAWKDKGLARTIFGTDLEMLAGWLADNGVKFLYNGYSWWVKSSDNLSLFESTIKVGTGKEANGRSLVWKEVKKNVISPKIEVNCLTQLEGSQWVNKAFFGDDQPRYIFRFATTKELSGMNGAFESMQDEGNGIEDVYVYTKEYDVNVGASKKMDSNVLSENNAFLGDPVKNKKDDETGVYFAGDVVMDEEDSYWVCIYGAACSKAFGLTDKTAWFVSFDNITTGGNGLPDNIVKEDEVDDVALRVLWSMFNTQQIKDPKYDGPNNLGIWLNAYFCNIDFSKLFCEYDSVWHFYNNNKDWDSPSVSYGTNVAYIGNDGQLKLVRCIGDMTFAGNHRTNSPKINGKKLDYMKYAYFKHYEVYDESKIEPLTDEEKNAKMTLWQKPWPVTGDEMRFNDLYDQAMVNKYAANDKWVRLPEHYTKQGRQPRTAANSNNITWQQYLYKREKQDFANPAAVSMFNEPILLMRVMKVTDNGGLRPNLMSQDGRKLTVLKLHDNAYFYQSGQNGFWNNVMKFNYESSGDVTLDNKDWNTVRPLGLN